MGPPSRARGQPGACQIGGDIPREEVSERKPIPGAVGKARAVNKGAGTSEHCPWVVSRGDRLQRGASSIDRGRVLWLLHSARATLPVLVAPPPATLPAPLIRRFPGAFRTRATLNRTPAPSPPAKPEARHKREKGRGTQAWIREREKRKNKREYSLPHRTVRE